MSAPSIRDKSNITKIELRRSVNEAVHSLVYDQSIADPKSGSPYEPVVVIDEEEVMFTGIRDTATFTYDNGSYSANFTARSKNSVLMDSSMGTLKPKVFQFGFKDISYRDLCNAICSRFRVPVQYEARDNPSIPHAAYSIDEKALSILSKYAIEHQKLLTSNSKGDLVVFHGSRSSNVLNASAILKLQINYDDTVYYRLFGSYRKATVNEAGEYRVADTGPGVVERYMVEKSTQGGLQSRADVMRSTSEANAAKVVLTVGSWRDELNAIYDCGNILMIRSQGLGARLADAYYIERAFFTYENEGAKKCELTLTHPNSYDLDKRLEGSFLR